MATVPLATNSSENGITLSTAQTGNGDSTNTADRGVARIGQAGAVVITTTVGATPTVTVLIMVSADGVNFYGAPYALQNSPETVTVSSIVITTATTSTYFLRTNNPWRYLKLNYSANTNVTVTATAYL